MPSDLRRHPLPPLPRWGRSGAGSRVRGHPDVDALDWMEEVMATPNSTHGHGAVASRCLRAGGAALFLLGWFGLALFLLGWCGAAFAATEGEAAPAIRAKLLDGTTVSLAEDAGKVVVVNMWATWCAPCREEMPALDAYYRAHRDEGLVLVALSMDDPKDEAKVRAMTKGYSF